MGDVSAHLTELMYHSLPPSTNMSPAYKYEIGIRA